jgi:Helix-turn-helix domain
VASTASIHFLQLTEEILTPQELAERLKVGVSWIYEQTRSRAGARNEAYSTTPLPYRKMGKYLRFACSEVAESLEELRANGGPKQ